MHTGQFAVEARDDSTRPVFTPPAVMTEDSTEALQRSHGVSNTGPRLPKELLNGRQSNMTGW